MKMLCIFTGFGVRGMGVWVACLAGSFGYG